MKLACACLLTLASCIAMSDAQAAWLHACNGEAADTPAVKAVQRQPEGGTQTLFVDEQASHPGCRSRPLAVAASAVTAIHPLPRQANASFHDGIVLQGAEREGKYEIASVAHTTPEPKKGRSPAPFNANLLTGMRLQVFGMEERVRASLRDGLLELECRPGSRPAGVVLLSPWYLPLADLRLLLRGEGKGRFDVLVADSSLVAKDAARVTGKFEALDAGNTAILALPSERFDRRQWQSVTIACPAQESRLKLTSLQLQPQPSVNHARSTWIWQAAAWQNQPEEVLSLAARFGVRQLFISIPVSHAEVAQPDRLASFIRLAAGRGLDVWSVDGDPHMTLPHEHAAAAMRIRAYAAFNQRHPATPIAGMQFDVEPYLLPGYELASSDWDKAYLAMARALRSAAGSMPLEFVVPFWWADKDKLLDGLAAHSDRICVMDYRTDASEIFRFAVPFLDWGSKHRKQVRIALESGPVGVEVQRRYEPAAEGELWLVEGEPGPLLLLLDAPRTHPAGKAFRLASSKTFDGSATSFLSDAGRLLSVLPRLEAEFSAWRSFAGIALHEVK